MIRLCASLLLLPLCAAVFLTAADVLRAASETDRLVSAPLLAFGAGCLAWVAVWLRFKAPVKAYVFGHEMTHALWALMFGARVGRMRVSDKGGSVMLSKSNAWISLAPYFFPFYTMLTAGVYLLASCFADMARFRLAFLFLVAFTGCLHVTFTITTLRVRQPDVMEHGRVFSWVVIWLLNVAQAGLWITATTPVTLQFHLERLCARTAGAYAGTGAAIHFIYSTVAAWSVRFFT